MDYASGITETELKILNQALDDYIMKLETKEGQQSEIDEVEALQKKLNREEGKGVVATCVASSRARHARFKKPRYCGEARHGGFRHWDVVEGDLILYKEHYEGGTCGHRLARVLGLATHDDCGKEYTAALAMKGKIKKAPRLLVLAASNMLDFGYERHIEVANVEEVMWRGADRSRDFARWFLFGTMPSPELAAAVCDYGAMSDSYLAKYLTAPEGELREDWREVNRVKSS